MLQRKPSKSPESKDKVELKKWQNRNKSIEPNVKGFLKFGEDKNRLKRGEIKRWELVKIKTSNQMDPGLQLKELEERNNNKLPINYQNILNKAISKSNRKWEALSFSRRNLWNSLPSPSHQTCYLE